MKLSVIIVNYNVKYFLEQCLCSVNAAVKNIDAEIFVVDNCSADASIEYLQPKFSSVKFIANKENIGFAKANNIAIQQSSGEYILFLNPDTIIPEDALKNCVDFFEMNENAGAVGVRMIDGGGQFLPESKRSFPSPPVAFFKLTGLSALFPKSKIFGRYALGFLSENEIHEADVLAGAFMMVKKSALDKAGVFDERFFMYGEDIDLSYRIQQKGFQNYYLGNITIMHFKGESTKKISLHYVRMFFYAMSLFVKKHYRGAGAWLMYAALQAAVFLRAIISVVATPFKIFDGMFYKGKNKNHTKKILLAGDEASAKAAENIIKTYHTNALFETISAKNFPNKLIADEIIFCMGDLSYKDAILLLQKIPQGIYVKWFGQNSQSIAGSNHKNKNGEIYFSIHN